MSKQRGRRSKRESMLAAIESYCIANSIYDMAVFLESADKNAPRLAEWARNPNGGEDRYNAVRFTVMGAKDAARRQAKLESERATRERNRYAAAAAFPDDDSDLPFYMSEPSTRRVGHALT